ncbi:MAG: UDP-N-acetylmuramoyl-L-alanyl-D-glutamate--2,6-diaminopimelate ligase [Betaproteobacteria bacterium RIFCSPLOWO2_02_FULL_67_26]|nr:MAG: UDP-N-acetylmuramoyl-L-alanyl-D-glutamate--2,6-diaminopimelate ligase [Betaproteobacteria bacterium RIFCSPLOWO2_02_FULL_67_26]
MRKQAVVRLDWKAIEALGIKRLENDSRRVRRGDTFVAYPGESRDGRAYIAPAIARGASSVLWERAGFEWNLRWPVPNAGVRALRRLAGEIASRAYGVPSRRLSVIGVTGTNGKTTCSQWIAQALQRTGRRCAVIGTLGYGMRAPLHPLVNTTPDALWLHAQLADFARRGAQAVAMEVSSIGLDQDRVAGIEFETALFTNLSRDHLEYHRSMRRYRDAKARLFAWETLKHAVVNLDDDFGAELARRIQRPRLKVIGYGFEPAGGVRAARVSGANLVTGAWGVRFDVRTPWGAARVASPVLGRYNAANLLATLAVLLARGVPLRRAVAALATLRPAAGRLQRLGGGAKPLVLVDYAHTPDALQQVLTTLRELLASSPSPITHHPSRLICVFGCGGDRDRGKRPLMGRAAAQLADRVIVTSDNPRSENPRRIIADIVAGARGRAEGIAIEADRSRAVRRAVAEARRGDIVLVAGKGHEDYQEVRGARRPFSDAAVARKALAER